jgi:serine protease inhibitor
LRQDGAVPFSDASVRLAAALLRAVPQERNVVTSPLSTLLALAALREGAAGTALAQLDEVIGGNHAEVVDLRDSLAAFDGDVGTLDRTRPPRRPLLHIANAVFVRPRSGVSEEFWQRAVREHATLVAEADFAGHSAKSSIDAWVERETGGLLTEAPADPDPETVVALFDVVTFAARWRSEFDAERTAPGAFTRADGTVVQVPMMRQHITARHADGPGWRSVVLPYTDGFEMRVVLADAGSVPVQMWRDAAGAVEDGTEAWVDLAMPGWEQDANLELERLLAWLGVEGVFQEGGLEGLFPGAYVDLVAQATTIKVAERGTVAAAATQEDTRSTAYFRPDVELTIDRPFEYQVVHRRTGLVLFAGRVADPSAG